MYRSSYFLDEEQSETLRGGIPWIELGIHTRGHPTKKKEYHGKSNQNVNNFTHVQDESSVTDL